MATARSHDRTNAKRTKLLDDDSSAESSAEDVQPNVVPAGSFTINEEYAKRFEHNKKREERQRLEEKYGSSMNSNRKRLLDAPSEDEDDSTDESEDDDADLVTADVDEEIFATLDAIKRKDPRVYDTSVKFYREFDPEAQPSADQKKAEKPLYLQDYHRENLLAGQNGKEEDEEADAPQTYQQEQDSLKRQLVGAMHAADQGGDNEDEDFLVAKKKSRHDDMPTKKVKKITDEDVKAADKDPETFLSNFMAAQAWRRGDEAKLQPFESDDSEDDARADAFEEAYNLRFEDPQAANEKLQSFARDVGKYGARREEKTGRKMAREREREKKEAAKREREEDKARLRKLKIEEAEEKVQRIKEAAGLRGKDLDLDQWRDVLEDDFDDDKWEQEMKRRFGEDYYAEDDRGLDLDEDEDDDASKKRKTKKPKWNDDIDIKDLVPDFEDDEQPKVTLSSDEEDAPSEQTKKKKGSSSDEKRAARKERRKIEEIVDAAMPVHLSGSAIATQSSGGPSTGFRYRETSPTSYGLSARDILFADDTQLNQFHGLKKLAAFRDDEKKRRDKKKFSKKARLKQWRKETFGTAEEPSGGFERLFGNSGGDAAEAKSSAGASKKTRKHKKAKKSVSDKN